ncbi:MAG: Crp/Fnr family transcriptional regulator [Bacteroidales bacterium]|nr:Crp/Fnr family transcriptional regulator [Bacteroidales bacterium]
MKNFKEDTHCRDCIAKAGCFKRFLPDEIDFLNEHKTQVLFRKGETVCKKGVFPSNVKYIADGLVKVFIEGPNNRNIIVKLVSTGDFLGLSSICGTKTYTYSATALKDTMICMIHRESFLELIKKNGDFALEITRWYCRSYDKVYKKLGSIGFKNLPGRIADVLFYLDQKKFRKANAYTYLKRKCIAEMAGVPMESAVRILSEFDKSNIIRISGKEIEIINTKLLLKIRSGG